MALTEQETLANILKSQDQGGSAMADGSLGAGADVPAVLDENPATRQLVEEQIQTRMGNAGAATNLSNAYTGRGTTDVAPDLRSPDGSTGAGGGTTETTTLPESTGAGGGSDFQNQITDAYGSLLQPGLSREELQAQEMKAMQSQIDAVNAIYDAKVREENRQGQGRMGQGAALNVASGTAYSPFGVARSNEIERKNQEIVNAVNAERQAALSELFTEARNNARQEAQSQQEQLRLATDSFISNTATAIGLSQEAANAMRDDIYKRAALTGIFEGNTTLDAQQQEATIQSILMQTAVAADQNARDEKEYGLLEQQAFRENRQLFTDPITGTVTSVSLSDPSDRYQVFQFAQAPSYSGGGGGGGGRSGGGGGGSSSGGDSGSLASGSDFLIFNEVASGDVRFSALSAAEQEAYSRAEAEAERQTNIYNAERDVKRSEYEDTGFIGARTY